MADRGLHPGGPATGTPLLRVGELSGSVPLSAPGYTWTGEPGGHDGCAHASGVGTCGAACGSADV